ncbi:hypothetical protein T492DRAFT_151763 [Pavlovales sp. CCMP2436]|nr:hypothetical protein T492DRAFT_151763 [Pavlovales sp. CCMP2436]
MMLTKQFAGPAPPAWQRSRAQDQLRPLGNVLGPRSITSSATTGGGGAAKLAVGFTTSPVFRSRLIHLSRAVDALVDVDAATLSRVVGGALPHSHARDRHNNSLSTNKVLSSLVQSAQPSPLALASAPPGFSDGQSGDAAASARPLPMALHMAAVPKVVAAGSNAEPEGARGGETQPQATAR